MATIKQKQAVKRIIENHGNISKSMREVGYKANTAKKPTNLTESKGFKQLMTELGLTEQFITNALVEDITDKKGRRVEELKLGAKILRMTDDNLNVGGELKIELVEIGSD